MCLIIESCPRFYDGQSLDVPTDMRMRVATGVAAVVVPAVQLLDRIYATRVTLEGLARRHGERPLGWPVHVVEQLTQRNAQLVAQIQDLIGEMPSSVFHPLGALLISVASLDG